jgi:hypothetical protein
MLLEDTNPVKKAALDLSAKFEATNGAGNQRRHHHEQE